MFPLTNRGDLTFGRAACDPQLLVSPSSLLSSSWPQKVSRHGSSYLSSLSADALTRQIFAFYASVMRDADRTATAETPLAKYVEALFRLKWSYAQFCDFIGVPGFEQLL